MNWTEDADRIRGMRPRNIVFLCVANSSRSQMAEAIARALAGPSVRVMSAGTRPAPVHPMAIEALAELGIDISKNSSRGLDEIPAGDVDVVITLCGEDIGAAFPGNSQRIHWPLPDPTEATGSEADRMEAFRRVRDELMRRLAVALGRP